MTRNLRLIVLSVVAVAMVFTAGCGRKVEVKSGSRVTCSYGHVLSDDVRVVRVSAEEASRLRVKERVTTCDKHRQAQALYAEAQDAIEQGDLKIARDKLERVSALFPEFGNTPRQLAELKAKKKPVRDDGNTGSGDTGTGSGDGGSGGTGSTGGTTDGSSGGPGDGDTSVPAGKLTVWTPEALVGYEASKVRVDVFTVSRDYKPADKDVLLLAIVAEQQRTDEGAKALLDKMVKSVCSYDVRTVQVNGRNAYFGTDGRTIATIGFTEGPVMVAIQMVDYREGSPERLRDALIAAANQLP